MGEENKQQILPATRHVSFLISIIIIIIIIVVVKVDLFLYLCHQGVRWRSPGNKEEDSKEGGQRTKTCRVSRFREQS